MPAAPASFSTVTPPRLSLPITQTESSGGHMTHSLKGPPSAIADVEGFCESALVDVTDRLYRPTEQVRVVVPVTIACSVGSLIPLIDPRGFPWWVFLASSILWALLAWRLARAGLTQRRG